MARSSNEGARLAPPAPRTRRTWGQRALLTLSSLLLVAAVVAASVAGWAYWQLRSIDRADVALDARLPDEPTNYLIVGSDSRAGGDPDRPGEVGEQRASLADTIMVLRVDAATDTARLLSVPRDLWVTLPNGEKGRVNASYAGGAQDLIDTVRRELDVPIHHYLAVDFQGFGQIVSAIDGVPVWFDRAVRDRASGLYVDQPGCLVLDGPGALALARSRQLQHEVDGSFTYDGTGDLGRMNRQQEFLRLVIDRAKVKGVRDPLTAKQLVEVGAANLTLDDGLAVTELLALGSHFADFDSGALETHTLPATPRTTAGGADILEIDEVPAEVVLARFRDVVEPVPATSTPEGGPGSSTGGTLPPPGSVTLSVWNGTSQAGLAHEVADRLTAEGFAVSQSGNASDEGWEQAARTVVRFGAGAEAEARTAAAHLPGDVGVEPGGDLVAGAVAVVVGDDLATGTVVGPDGAPGASTSTTATTAPVTTTTVPVHVPDPVGVVPIGDPPPGRSCG